MSRWVKYALGFAVVAVLGLAMRFPTAIPLVGKVVDSDPGLHSLVLLSFSMLVVFIAGYLLPKGFWLWGIAVVSLRIPVDAVLVGRELQLGRVSESQVGGLIFVVIVFYVMTIVSCTIASTAGAGLNLLRGRFQGRMRA